MYSIADVNAVDIEIADLDIAEERYVVLDGTQSAALRGHRLTARTNHGTVRPLFGNLVRTAQRTQFLSVR